MTKFLWLTSVETSEPVGLPVSRIAMIEQKGPQTGDVVAVHLDTGQEVRVIEKLGAVQAQLSEN